MSTSSADAQERTTHASRKRSAPEFVAWLQQAMADKVPGGLKIRQLAEYTGLAHSALASILRGETRPSLETAYKLADYFGVERESVARLAGYGLGEPAPALDPATLAPDLRRLWDQLVSLSPHNRRLAEDIITQLAAADAKSGHSDTGEERQQQSG